MIILSMGVLAAAVAALAFRMYQYKRQIRDFTKTIRKRKNADWNTPVTVDCFGTDIVELANALNAYTEVQKGLARQYEEDRRALKHVIAGISHDFRTPLTAAKGYMQLLEKSAGLTGKEKEYLDIAMDKVTYLKLLSDDFFEISSWEAKEDKTSKTFLNVGNFLAECILQQYGWIEERKIRTDFQLPESDLFVETNEHDLKRMMENLFSNVRKYVNSYVGVKVCSENDALVLIVENDMEEGRTPDTDRIFEPFYRDSARSMEGSGLGLYVVSCLAEGLGIGLEAECKTGIFRIRMQF